MNLDLLAALEQLEKEKSIKKAYMLDAIETALAIAYKKTYSTPTSEIKVEINPETGDTKVYKISTVVADEEAVKGDITVTEAKKLNPNFDEGDILTTQINPEPFGRIAAQTAKQVVLQKIREAESGMLYQEFRDREDTLINGVVRRIDKKNVIVEIGNTEAVLPPNEQIDGESLRPGDRIKLYVAQVNKTNYGPEIVVSRSNSGLVAKLFDNEVPEIHDGTVVIKAIAREAGSRTKIAVVANDPNVDPIGSCVGQKGTRVQRVVDALGGEKIDIVKWSEDPKEFIAAALSPAKVVGMDVEPSGRSCKVLVPGFQLSLAIGKEGQNARLAAKLTGWKIDIKSDDNNVNA